MRGQRRGKPRATRASSRHGRTRRDSQATGRAVRSQIGRPALTRPHRTATKGTDMEICPRCGEEVDELFQPIGELEDACQRCLLEVQRALDKVGLDWADLV